MNKIWGNLNISILYLYQNLVKVSSLYRTGVRVCGGGGGLQIGDVI